MLANEVKMKDDILTCLVRITELNNSHDADKVNKIKYELESILAFLPVYRKNLGTSNENLTDDPNDFNSHIFLLLESFYKEDLDLFEFYSRNFLIRPEFKD